MFADTILEIWILKHREVRLLSRVTHLEVAELGFKLVDDRQVHRQ